MKNTIRKRVEESANYSSVFINGKTLRIPLDSKKPITELRFPEFYDISFGTKCKSGQTLIKQPDGSKKNCYYCYASASLSGEYYTNVVDKVKWFFGNMNENQRPWQWAAGGSSEPIEHPDFWKASLAAKELGIVPNYTTNGMLVTDEVAEKTNELEALVAITFHPHMEQFYRKAVKIYNKHNIKINAHVILSDEESILKFESQYQEFKDNIDYFVILPYMNVGHAAKYPKKINYEALENAVDKIYADGKLAFGANLYNWLKKKHIKDKYEISIYPPELLSKYISLGTGDKTIVSSNSFDETPVPFTHENGCELGHARTNFDIV
jgi:sulfatase maturation enzyme AslB (radical SAM superfamily)